MTSLLKRGTVGFCAIFVVYIFLQLGSIDELYFEMCIFYHAPIFKMLINNNNGGLPPIKM